MDNEQMPMKEINQVLNKAFNQRLPVRVKLISGEVVCGYFLGQAYDDEFVVNETSIYWERLFYIIMDEKVKSVASDESPLPYPFE
jgi:hypothetical protein